MYIFSRDKGKNAGRRLSRYAEVGYVLTLDDRNEYLNSKAGIAEFAEEEE
jgi:hypothetical protein